MALQGDLGAPDPDRGRRFRRSKLPDLRPIAVRQALQQLRERDAVRVRERDRLEPGIRRTLRES